MNDVLGDGPGERGPVEQQPEPGLLRRLRQSVCQRDGGPRTATAGAGRSLCGSAEFRDAERPSGQSIEHDDGPYARFNAEVGAVTAGAYESAFAKRLGGDADDVARAIERAVTARRPRTRSRVTPSAHFFIGLRRLLPDRAWDAVVGRSYPKP